MAAGPQHAADRDSGMNCDEDRSNKYYRTHRSHVSYKSHRTYIASTFGREHFEKVLENYRAGRANHEAGSADK